jgi:hypothetical protein
VTGIGFEVREGRHEKMPDRDRRVAIALLTQWFEHVQVGGAFNDTIFAIFSEDSPLGRFADGEMISFDEETLYEDDASYREYKGHRSIYSDRRPEIYWMASDRRHDCCGSRDGRYCCPVARVTGGQRTPALGPILWRHSPLCQRRPVDERYAMMEANLSDPSPQVHP